MLPILTVAGPYIAMATAIGVVIAGIVIAVKGANAEFHKFDTAVENAEQKVKSANANFKQAKEELKQVQETLTNIKNDDDAFKGLTKGTIE
jgi:multidrug resistance efflux pump